MLDGQEPRDPSMMSPAALHVFSCTLLSLGRLSSAGFCPQGFGNPGMFPPEWEIPTWPEMSQAEAFRLRVITLGGFQTTALNEEYLEGPTEEFKMQGRETYWQASGKYFLYHCARFKKWRIAAISAFSENRNGNCFAFVSDAYPDRDILNKTFIKDWIEVDDGKWVRREDAGVASWATLEEQLMAGDEYEEVEEEVVDGECASPDADGAPDFVGEKPKKSNCPIMPTVRKVKRKVKKVVSEMSKWVQRLFPKLLGAPEEAPEEEEDEDAEDEEPGGEADAGAAPKTAKKTKKVKKKSKWEENWESSSAGSTESTGGTADTVEL